MYAYGGHAALLSTPPSQPLGPGESYLTTLVFDVPADARNPKLLIADTDPMASLVVDHENSPLHGKIISLAGSLRPRDLSNAITLAVSRG